MNKTKNDIEIMSPVGSYETLMAAIQGGAQSVYFGVGKLNMRSASTLNFTIDDLETIVNICNENKVKAYLTVNTVIYDHEVTEMKALVNKAKETGIHAIIATDLAVLQYAQSIGMEIHASTQLNISNIEAVKFFSAFCDVMVLARELSIEQTAFICRQIDEQNICGPSGKKVRIELFVHGALCMSISGKCYLSLHENNHSANRGACLQNCRRTYTVTDKETGYQLDIENEYIMSPKDLCTIHLLDKILDAGVTVLKIEGRARAPEYVKTVTRCYHEAVEAYFDKNYNQQRIAEWMEQLKQVYNRGFWSGYYLGEKLGEWSENYGSSATKQKVYIGKITNYFKKIGVAEILIETHSIETGQELLIIGPTTGVLEYPVHEIRLDDKPAAKAVKGQKCSIPLKTTVRKNDKIYRWEDRH
ncbi:MAG TPA: peptidase U32 family protein [Bacteroidales bacterium]|jgi:putative protease|nr:peptidase U32 family protein [Bacteroidales bacterium]